MLKKKHPKKKPLKARRDSWFQNHRWEIFGITIALSLELVALLGLTLFYSYSNSGQALGGAVRALSSISDSMSEDSNASPPVAFQK